MITSFVSRTVHRLAVKSRAAAIRTVTNLRDRTEGVAAVEFALILPVMSMMMLGAIEMSQAVTVDRRVSMVASATGDLVARSTEDIREDEILDIARVGSWLLKPFAPQGLRIELSYVTASNDALAPGADVPVSDPNQKTRWRCVFDGNNATSISCTCPNQQYTTPRTGLLQNKSDAMVVADVKYDYRPIFVDYFMKNNVQSTNGAYRITEKLHLKARGAKAYLNNTAGDEICGGF